MAAHKTFRTKRILAKKIKQNRPMPQFLRKMTGVRHVANPERRHWRRRKLNI
jgi:large subunit ribosomal protein L39e